MYMPPELRPDDPREWLRRAKSNLIQAKNNSQGIYLEDLCFLAQQAVEKALKGLLLHRKVKFPYIHDIAELIRLVEKSDIEVPLDVREAARLSDFAVEARYPGLAEPVSQKEYLECLNLAEKVVLWVEKHITTSISSL